jgi:Tfp pilus assembly protein PilF
LNELGFLYHYQGKYGEVEPFYLRSLKIREQQLGPEHPDVANSLNNLAAFYCSQGKYSEAEPLFVRSLEILMLTLEQDHPYTQLVRSSLMILKRQISTGLDSATLE